MKLNKRGWGYFQMMWMTGIILFFFLLAIILIVRFYHSLDLKVTSTTSVEMKTKEQMVKDLEYAAEAYMEYNYKDLRDVNDIRLTSHKLYKAGLFAKDLYGGCTGYVIASKINGAIQTQAYIKCGDYKSPGFENY